MLSIKNADGNKKSGVYNFLTFSIFYIYIKNKKQKWCEKKKRLLKIILKLIKGLFLIINQQTNATD